MANDLVQVVQAWVPPTHINRVLEALMQHISWHGDVFVTGFNLLDDRTKSGCYLIRFSKSDGLNILQVKRLIGKGIEVDMVNV